MMVPFLALVVCVLAPPPQARVHVTVECDRAAKVASWNVRIEASGLDTRVRDLSLRLENWGEWKDVAAKHVLDVDAQFPIAVDPADAGRWRLTLPKRWDGALWASYRIAVNEQDSADRRAHGLLPRRTARAVIGFTANTLMRLYAADEPIAAARTIDLIGGQDEAIISGLGATAHGRQHAKWDDDQKNTLIAFADPLSIATDESGKTPIEVVQLGGAAEVAPRVLAIVRRIADQATRSFGTPPARPIRIVITEPNEGGVRVEGAICCGFSDSMATEHPSPYAVQFVAHEMTHDWLGGRIAVDDGKCAWFVEGFTEYFSLWIVAAAGLVDRAWFVERLTELDAEVSKLPAYGTAAFSDPALKWRDAAIEPLAYQAAPSLAFALDVELRKAKKPGLPALVRDLIAREVTEAGTKEVVEWLDAQGLEKCVKRWIDGKERAKPQATARRMAGAKDGEEKALPEEFWECGE